MTTAAILEFTGKIDFSKAAYIDTADVAKIVRKVLKEAFPEVKFSVRSERYSMGSSIDVRWTDGPLAATVEAFVKRFQSTSFDGMTDSSICIRHTMAGAPIKFGTGYLFCHREVSDAKRDALVAVLDKMDADQRTTFAIRYGVRDGFIPPATNRELAWQMLSTNSPIDYSDRKSATAESVVVVSRS